MCPEKATSRVQGLEVQPGEGGLRAVDDGHRADRVRRVHQVSIGGIVPSAFDIAVTASTFVRSVSSDPGSRDPGARRR